MINPGSVFVGGVNLAGGGGGGGITDADSGLSLVGGDVVILGQSIGEAGDPAELLQDTEVPMNGFSFRFTGETTANGQDYIFFDYNGAMFIAGDTSVNQNPVLALQDNGNGGSNILYLTVNSDTQWLDFETADGDWGLTFYNATGNLGLGVLDNGDNGVAGVQVYPNLSIGEVNDVGANPVQPLVWDTVTSEVLKASGLVASVVGANGITVDDTDPLNPVVSLGDSSSPATTPFASDRYVDFNGHTLHWQDSATEYLFMNSGGYHAEGGAQFESIVDNDVSRSFYAHGTRAGFMRVDIENTLTDESAAAGALFVNDVGHILQIYNASSVNDPPLLPDSSMIRTNGAQLILHNDNNVFLFDYTSVFDAPETSMKSFSSGNWMVQGTGTPTDNPDNGFVLQVLGNGAYFSTNPDNSLNGSALFDMSGVPAPNQPFLQIQDPQYIGTYAGGLVQLEDFSGSGDEATLTPAALAIVTPTLSTFIAANEVLLSSAAATVELEMQNDQVLFTDSAGNEYSYFHIDQWVISDSSGLTGNNVIVQAPGITLNDAAASTAGNITPGGIEFDDPAFVATYGLQSMQLSNAAGTVVSQITDQDGFINAPSVVANFATFDVYGSISTNDPDSGIQDAAWNWGLPVAAASTVNLTQYVAVWINGTRIKLATMN